MLRGKSAELSLPRRKVPGVTCGCSVRSSSGTACRSPSIAIGTRCFGLAESPTLDEQLINKRPLTKVGRALDELGVTLILAGSPQAKGRIERLWGTFQDRLVNELRLAKAKTFEQAQAVLDHYLLEHNRKFSKPARAQPAWSKASAQQIDQALRFKDQRNLATTPLLHCSMKAMLSSL
jgi:hypothetical protein